MKYELRIMMFVSTMILSSLFITAPAHAQAEISTSQITPASPFYFFESVKEALELKFAESVQDKGLKYFKFAQQRIIEAKQLVKENRTDLIPPLLERYYSNLNKVLGLGNDKALGPYLVDEVGKNAIALNQLEDQTENPKAKMSIRALIYRILIWTEDFYQRLNPDQKNNLLAKTKANQAIICDFLSKEASSSALNQTEKAVLLERVQKCLKK